MFFFFHRCLILGGLFVVACKSMRAARRVPFAACWLLFVGRCLLFVGCLLLCVVVCCLVLLFAVCCLQLLMCGCVFCFADVCMCVACFLVVVACEC